MAPPARTRVLATVGKAVWERRSCGAGTKGERYYDWAAVVVTVKDFDARVAALAGR